MASILDSSAHQAAAERLLATGGSVYRAFDGMDLPFDHNDAIEFLEGTETFMELDATYRHKVAGMVMAFAMVAVLADRETRGR